MSRHSRCDRCFHTCPSVHTPDSTVSCVPSSSANQQRGVCLNCEPCARFKRMLDFNQRQENLEKELEEYRTQWCPDCGHPRHVGSPAFAMEGKHGNQEKQAERKF